MPKGTPENDAPESYRRALLRIGGTVPGRKLPLWRVCLAENCTRKSSGIVHHLPTGNVSVFEVDPKGTVHGRQNLCGRVESGTFELPRYAVEGWISERHFPATTWGTPEEWASHRAEDGGQVLASEYPSNGDYFMVGGPWEKLPELGDLETSIRMWEHAYRNRPTNLVQHYRQELAKEEEIREARRLKLEKELEYMRRNELVPILKSGSLSAQAVRNDLQKMTGDASHLGVVLNP